MLITPLQVLLRDKGRSQAEIMQAAGCSRFTVRRWRRGESYPDRVHAERLIGFFGSDQLDYNGCYIASVEVTDGEG
ncbi:MAG: helix-turn-helix domain-containing protein [Dehalococcoidia bacterium]